MFLERREKERDLHESGIRLMGIPKSKRMST
jgi:hypothetical protein